MIRKYIKIWWLFAGNSFQVQLVVRWALALFLLAKLLRFTIFTIFIILLLNKTKVLAGYSLDQTILFFLSFNLVDMLSQLLFREVYKFRPTIIEGTFDYYLIKPFNPLFRALATGPDLLDLITLIPLIGAITFFINRLDFINLSAIFTYIFLIFTAFIISLSFHILVLSLAILTTEIDHAVMVYRDIAAMGRMPIDIYREPIRGLITFIIPVGLMMTFPAKALMGLLSPIFIIYTIIFTLGIYFASIKIWNYSIKKYSSASS